MNDFTPLKEKAVKVQRSRSALLIAVSMLPVGILGCPQVTVPQGLLTGRWEVVPDGGFGGSLSNLFVIPVQIRRFEIPPHSGTSG